MLNKRKKASDFSGAFLLYCIMEQAKKEAIAVVVHAAIKAWNEAHGDFSLKDWNEAEQWQRDSTFQMIDDILLHQQPDAEQVHNLWMQKKLADGWVYGEIKSSEKKTHPCLVPFSQLSDFERKKDSLVKAIVSSLI